MIKPNLKIMLENFRVTDEKATINTLAKNCYTSTMQLQRDFYNVTGYSVNEYMRRLRLSNALCLIKNSDRSLADIAYSCGYSSQQALCREIKSILNTTATAYKESGSYYFLSALTDDIPFQIEVSKVTVPETVCLRYYCHILRGIENDAVNLFLHVNSGYGGRIFGRDGKQNGNMFCYELYAENTENLNASGFEKADVHAGYEAIYAQTRVKNSEDEINAAWDYLYSSWLPGSMFEYAGQSDDSFKNRYFEEYFYKNSVPQRLKLYLPVIRKKELIKISVETIPSLRFLVSARKGYNAENEASRDVVDFLSENYPYIIKNSKEFFFRQKHGGFTCGVRINADLIKTGGLHILNYQNQAFAVLYLGGIGDYTRTEQILSKWLSENNFISTGEPFAVYDTEKSYENPQMKLYCPIKIC